LHRWDWAKGFLYKIGVYVNFENLFNPEVLLLAGFLFIGGVFLFFLINKNLIAGIYVWLLSVLFLKYQQPFRIQGLPLPDLSIDRILFILLAVIFTIGIFTKRYRLFPFTWVEYSMFLFCMFAVLSMIYTGFIFKEDGRIRIKELLTGYIMPFYIFFISQNSYETREKREGFIKFIILVGLYLSFTAIFEHFSINQLVFPKFILDPGFGIHMERARGPFGQAAVNGTVLGFVLAALTYFLFNPSQKSPGFGSTALTINLPSRAKSRDSPRDGCKLLSAREGASAFRPRGSTFKKSGFWRLCSLILLIATPVAIFFTYTRAAWIAGLLSFAIIITFNLRQRQKIATLALIALCTIAVLGTSFFLEEKTTGFALNRARDESPVYDRLNLYIASVNMFIKNPVFGVGFGKFSDNSPAYFENVSGIPYQDSEIKEHDTFMAVLAEMGMVGISLILCIFISILSRSIKLYRKLNASDSAEKGIVVIFWGFMAVYIVNSMLIEMRYFEFVNAVFFIFAGFICRGEKGYGARAY